MQLTDKDGNIFGTGGLEITTSTGKPKIPVINTDITIGTTSIVGGVAGRLLFDDAGVVGETNGVHWDKVNSRMGFGTTTPAYGISHIGNIGVAGIFSQRDFGFGAYSQITQRASYIAYTTDGTTGLAIGAASGGARIQGFNGLPATSEKPIFLQSLGGNVGIGTTTDAGFKLDVNGKLRAIGADYGVYLGFNVDVQNGLIANALYIRSGSNTLGGLFPYSTGTGGIQLQSASSQPIIRGAYNEDTTIFPARNTTDNLGDVVIQGGGSERVRFKANGNVGIGTTSPTSILDAVVSNGAKSGLRFRGYSDASTPYLLSLGTYTYSDIFQITSVNGLVSLNNTSLYALALGTNNTERLRITSTGNVLINTTTNAGYKLDINGTVRITDNLFLASTQGLYFTTTALGILGNSGIGTISFLTNSISRLSIDNSGNINAINSPTAAFSNIFITGSNIEFRNGIHYFSWENNGNLFQIKNITNANTIPFAIFKATNNIGINTTTDAGFRLDVTGTIRSTGTNGLILSDGTYAAKTWMNGYIYTIEKEGSYGISTYQLKYNDTTDALYLSSTSIRGDASYGVVMSRSIYAPHNGAFGFLTYGTTTQYTAIQALYTDNNSSGIAFNYKTANVDTEAMRITSVGRVGIGTTTPSYKLHTVGSAGFDNGASGDAITILNSGYIQSSLIRFRGFATQFIVQDNSYNTKFAISTSGSFSYFNTGGNVGINTTTDSGYTLNVNGSGYFNGNVKVNGAIQASTPTASSYICHIGLIADQVLVSGADAVLDFVDFADANNWYDPTTKRFLPNVAGYYHIDFSLWFEPSPVSTGQYNIQVRKNGTTVMIAQQPTINNGTGQSLMSSKLVYFNGTTDYIDFTAFQSTGSNRNILKGTDSSGTYATIHLLAV